MAEAANKSTNHGFNPKPNEISTEEYQVIVAEQQTFEQKQLDAGSEFMWQHYNRLLRTIDESLARATRANLAAKRKERKEKALTKRQPSSGPTSLRQ